jgi:hypothetical protein
MIVDTSAIIAILRDEADANELAVAPTLPSPISRGSWVDPRRSRDGRAMW